MFYPRVTIRTIFNKHPQRSFVHNFVKIRLSVHEMLFEEFDLLSHDGPLGFTFKGLRFAKSEIVSPMDHN